MTKLETITVTRLTRADKATLDQINALLPQLSDDLRPLQLAELTEILQADANRVYVAIDTESNNAIVGMTLMVVVRQFAGTKCWIEDVVVSESYRGRGIAKQLMESAIREAPEKTSSINLTSNPSRASAHGLYHKLGFKVRDTTVFRYIPHSE